MISRSAWRSSMVAALCFGIGALHTSYDDSRPRGYSQSHWRKIRKDRSPIRQKHIPLSEMWANYDTQNNLWFRD
jgi:hypothetical protein